jgi:hypothetical protein
LGNRQPLEGLFRNCRRHSGLAVEERDKGRELDRIGPSRRDQHLR